MKKLLFLLIVFQGFFVKSQTVDDIINKHIEAMGGKEKLNNLQSIYMETVSVMQNGNEATAKVWKVNHKLLRREVDFGMGSFTMIMTDKEGWRSNPRNGGNFEPLPAENIENQQFELDCAGALFDYASKGNKAELDGREELNGVNYYKVKLTLKNGRILTYYINPDTYYIDHMKTKGGVGMRRRAGQGGGPNPDADVMMDYSDYRKVEGGYVFPFTIRTEGMGASTNVEKIEVNQPVDEKLYKPE